MSLKAYTSGVSIGIIITTIAIVILTFQNQAFMLIGGSILGIGLACLNNSLNQSWKRYEKGEKWGQFSWWSLKNSAVIGLSTGIITSTFSSIRTSFTKNEDGLALYGTILAFELVGSGVAGLVAKILTIWQSGRNKYFTKHLIYALLLSMLTVGVATCYSFLYKIVLVKIKGTTTESKDQTLLQISLGAVFAAISAVGTAAVINILVNQNVTRRRKINRTDLIDYIGDETEGAKIWDGLVSAGVIIIENISFQDAFINAQVDDGRVSQTYAPDQYPPISPRFDSAAKSFLAKYNDPWYNLTKTIVISTFVGLLMGGLIGFAQSRYTTQQEEIQEAQKENIKEFSDAVGKDPETVTVETLNKEAQELSQKYQSDANMYQAEAATTSDSTEKAFLLAEAQKSQSQADYYAGLMITSEQNTVESQVVASNEDYTVTKQTQIAVVLVQVQAAAEVRPQQQPAQKSDGGGDKPENIQLIGEVKKGISNTKDKNDTRRIELKKQLLDEENKKVSIQ